MRKTPAILKTGIAGLGSVLSIAVIAAALAPNVSAGCGDIPSKAARALMGTRASFIHADYNEHEHENASVVGMWNFIFLGSDGKTVVDFGYQQWHSDGTEITNSGGHDPATGNFCLGVWEKAGDRTFKLNHYALSYDKTTGMLAVVVNITEQVTVSHNGNSLSGSFTMSVYPYDATTGTTATTPVQTITGTVTGTRVTVN